MDALECQFCSSIDPIIVHHIPHRGAFASLCTPCVLRQHADSFCSICFDVFDNAATSNRPRVMCHGCPAMAHLTCLPSTRSSSALRYLCRQCSDPPASSSNGGAVGFTEDSRKQLACAASIASLFLHKAAAVARADAEEKIREAVLASGRAREAIDRAVYLAANQESEDKAEADEG